MSETSSKRLAYARKGTLSPLLACADFIQVGRGGVDATKVPLQESSVPNRSSCSNTRADHKINTVIRMLYFQKIIISYLTF
jgi:hypothetical protein